MASKPTKNAGGIAAALVASVAGLALVAGAASAQPGGGNGNGKGNDKGGKPQAAQSQKGQGNGGGKGADKGSANKGGTNKGDDKNRSQGNGARPNQQASSSQRGNGNGNGGGKSKSAGNPGKAQRQTVAMHSPVSPGNGKNNGKGPAKTNESAPGNGPGKSNNGGSGNKGKVAAGNPQKGNSAKVTRRPQRDDVRRVSYDGPGGRSFTVPTNDRVRVLTSGRSVDWSALDRRRAYDGCPPGLAKKYNGCTPPGLARKADRSWQRADWYGDWGSGYRYSDGYMLRTGGGGSSILSYIPLLAGALSIGNLWPGTYQSAALPDYYDSYYDLGGASSYRYYDDTIYRVDSGSSEIESIAALLTGNQISVGEPMPMGYDVYNVPYDYRDQYYDTPEANYRYSDGYIYQLDPTTQLVQAAIELLT
ncbi:hypothetical protein I5E68_02435 [Novosphingobium sp. YJ-S2-02]|uniref:Uncharacterized protein n=1 Tax=Novosphingobium aureum TaxID=2792964 RepID=A0A931HA86_9SPHN|nr:hypothetical protein [Novosphingobium aureum]MBH0111809.1 hypothetical protein [Novosphingobium aureum]